MVKVGDVVEHTAAVGAGPVNALDHALRKALEKFYPQLREVKLLDYKVRVLSANRGTESKVRVLIESGDHKDKWGTVGVSENIMEASWQALADSIEYKLLADRLRTEYLSLSASFFLTGLITSRNLWRNSLSWSLDTNGALSRGRFGGWRGGTHEKGRYRE